MWSGEGSEPLAAGQWLNPMMYQNVQNDQVDWATLAQQWIQMKETFPTVDQMNVLAPPPPPPPQDKEEGEKKDEGEKGEAPMDMELDGKDEEKSSMMGMNGAVAGWGSDWTQWQQWGWGGWNAAMPGAAVYPMGAYGDPGDGSVAYPQVDGTGKHTRGLGLVRHPNRVWRRGDKTLRGGHRADSRDRSESPEQPVIDAAKRKTLPAWIREGLEKMEREKQKKVMQEQEKLAREAKKKEEANQFDPLNPGKSKFDTDSEQSEAEDPNSERDEKSPAPSPPERRLSPPPPTVPKKLSKAEILETVMGIVRKQLTQLLMRVTSEEIERCVHEVYPVFPGLKDAMMEGGADFLTKEKSTQHQSSRRPATSRTKGNLGLGIYDDSATESSGSEDETESAAQSQQSAVPNEAVLRDQLIQRKREFMRVEWEIEDKLRAQERHERRAALEDEERESEDEDEEREVEDQVHRRSEDVTADNDDSKTQDSESDTELDKSEAVGSQHSPASGKKSKSPRFEEQEIHSTKAREDSVDRDQRRKRSDSREVSHGREKRKKERSYSREVSHGREKRKKERSYSREVSHGREKRKDERKRRENSEESHRTRDGSELSERKQKKRKKKKREKSRSRKGSDEARSRDKYRDSSREKYRDSSREKYRDSSREKYRESSREKYRDSNREKYRESSRDSRRSKKRHRSPSEDRSSRKKRSGGYDSDESRYSSRKKSRYSLSPDAKRKKTSSKRSRSRSDSYSSSRRRR